MERTGPLTIVVPSAPMRTADGRVLVPGAVRELR